MFERTNWFDAVTEPQTSDVEELEGVFRFGIAQSWTGNPEFNFGGQLQGSIDGHNWRAIQSIGGGGNDGGTDNYSQNSATHPIRFLRLVLTEMNFVGDPAATVTVSVIGVEVVSTVSSWDA
jgi:hypothetical protein